MNISKNKRSPRYICDKCKEEIPFIHHKGFVGINRYCKNTHRDQVYKKDFGLCESCEKKFREWLNTKEIPILLNLYLSTAEIISKFPVFIN